MNLLSRFLLVVALVSLVGCATAGSHIEMNVQAFADPEVAIAPGSTFATVPVGLTKNELLEKELLFIIRERLEAKGLRYSEERPEFLVATSGFMGNYDEYVPPSTIYFPVPGSTQTTNVTGNAGGVPIYGTATTNTSGTNYVPITRRGYTRTQYVRIIDVMVARPVVRGSESTFKAVWSGKVESTGSTGDLLLVATPLIDELLTEFPRRTGRDSRRVVGWNPPPR